MSNRTTHANPKGVFAACLILVGGLASPPTVASASPQRPVIVATNTILADIARNVAGNHADVHCLVSTGADPHGFDPKPADVAALAQADLIFANRAGFEPWLNRILIGANFRGKIVTATEGCELINRFEEDHAHLHPTEVDPHAWHDPKNGIIFADNIARALARIAPQNTQIYNRRARLYMEQLRGLDAWARRLFARVPPSRRRIVTSHDSLRYLGRAYRIEIIPVRGLEPQTEPDARQLAKLVDLLKSGYVRVVFLENTSNPKMIKQLAVETGAIIGGELYTDSIGEPGTLADSYLGMLRENVLTILSAFDQAETGASRE